MVNDEALRRYGFSEAEFLAKRVGELSVAPGMAGVPRSMPMRVVAEPRMVRHRTRAGAIIEVQLLSTRIELDGRPADLFFAMDVTDRLNCARAFWHRWISSATTWRKNCTMDLGRS